MQTKRELEDWYFPRPDPWDYKTTADDIYRKRFYLTVLEDLGPEFDRALDIGAGEGYITTDLPAREIHGIELSDWAAGRFPDNVSRVNVPLAKYDLVMTTGTLYQQYDHEKIYNWIMKCANGIICIGGIKDWLLPYDFGEQIRSFSFPYREYTGVLRVYKP